MFSDYENEKIISIVCNFQTVIVDSFNTLLPCLAALYMYVHVL